MAASVPVTVAVPMAVPVAVMQVPVADAAAVARVVMMMAAVHLLHQRILGYCRLRRERGCGYWGEESGRGDCSCTKGQFHEHLSTSLRVKREVTVHPPGRHN